MGQTTAPPPDIDEIARAAHVRLDKARDALERAQTEFIQAQRAAKIADDAWLRKHYPTLR